MGTILTSRIHALPFRGFGMKMSDDKKEKVVCTFSAYNCTNDNFGYKIKAVPHTEELQRMYGVGETYYTMDFESLMESIPEFSIEGYTPEIEKKMRSVYRGFHDAEDKTNNSYEEGSLEHFYMSELIEQKKKDDEYAARMAAYYDANPDDLEASAYI